MPYNPETEEFYQDPATIVDSTPDGDTVQEGFDDRLTPAMAGVYTDLNLLKENGMIGVGIPATTTSRGIARVATLADMEPGAIIENGPAVLAADGDYHLPVSWVPGLFVGDIRFLPFRAVDLATHCPGWYFCNGDQYTLTSPIGSKLNTLPANFKSDWGITVSGGNISIPNFFYTDGRGYFFRAVDGTTRQVGSVQQDAFQNHTHQLVTARYRNGAGSGFNIWIDDVSASTGGANSGRFDNETRALNVGTTPAIFLDV